MHGTTVDSRQFRTNGVETNIAAKLWFCIASVCVCIWLKHGHLPPGKRVLVWIVDFYLQKFQTSICIPILSMIFDEINFHWLTLELQQINFVYGNIQIKPAAREKWFSPFYIQIWAIWFGLCYCSAECLHCMQTLAYKQRPSSAFGWRKVICLFNMHGHSSTELWWWACWWWYSVNGVQLIRACSSLFIRSSSSIEIENCKAEHSLIGNYSIVENMIRDMMGMHRGFYASRMG